MHLLARSLLISKMRAKCSSVSLHDLGEVWLSRACCIGTLGELCLSSSFQNLPHLIFGSATLGSAEFLQQSRQQRRKLLLYRTTCHDQLLQYLLVSFVHHQHPASDEESSPSEEESPPPLCILHNWALG
jgi:hypothetical protein